MGRPRIDDADRHDHEFRLRLQENDAMLVRALSRKLGIAPAAFLRTVVRAKLATTAGTVPSDRIVKNVAG